MFNITWKCDICHKERPDNKISVYKSKHMMDGGFKVEQNVKYCNDSPECIVKAPQINWFKLNG